MPLLERAQCGDTGTAPLFGPRARIPGRTIQATTLICFILFMLVIVDELWILSL